MALLYAIVKTLIHWRGFKLPPVYCTVWISRGHGRVFVKAPFPVNNKLALRLKGICIYQLLSPHIKKREGSRKPSEDWRGIFLMCPTLMKLSL